MSQGGESDAERFCRLPEEFAGLAKSAPTRMLAHAKINAGLHITGLREDGYHLLDSVFAALERPCDVLHLAESGRVGLTVLFSDPELDRERNTLTRAYKVFADRTGFAPPLVVHVEKNIPWGAGLGGGSADAACLLKHLAGLFEKGGHTLANGLLTEIGARVGADVPFFYEGRPSRVTGIGENIEPIDPKGLEKLVVLLATPELRVSTPWAYRAYDEMAAERAMKNGSAGSTNGGSEKIQGEKERASSPDAGANPRPERADLPPVEALTRVTNLCMQCVPVGGPSRPVELVNDLEGPVFRRHPELSAIKAALLDHGALAASMTGSGSSVFGFFAERSGAERARAALDCPSTLTSMLAGS